MTTQKGPSLIKRSSYYKQNLLSETKQRKWWLGECVFFVFKTIGQFFKHFIYYFFTILFSQRKSELKNYKQSLSLIEIFWFFFFFSFKEKDEREKVKKTSESSVSPYTV